MSYTKSILMRHLAHLNICLRNSKYQTREYLSMGILFWVPKGMSSRPIIPDWSSCSRSSILIKFIFNLNGFMLPLRSILVCTLLDSTALVPKNTSSKLLKAFTMNSLGSTHVTTVSFGLPLVDLVSWYKLWLRTLLKLWLVSSL